MANASEVYFPVDGAKRIVAGCLNSAPHLPVPLTTPLSDRSPPRADVPWPGHST